MDAVYLLRFIWRPGFGDLLRYRRRIIASDMHFRDSKMVKTGFSNFENDFSAVGDNFARNIDQLSSDS